MTAKVWNVGDVLTASDVNVFLAPLSGVKSADQIITATTSLINDADMRIAIAANSIYEFNVHLRYASPTGGDWKSSFSVPAGASARFLRIGNNLSGGFAGVDDWSDASSVTSQGLGAGTPLQAHFTGWVITAGTAGNLIFQWAQNTSNAGNTTLFKTSFLSARRIG